MSLNTTDALILCGGLGTRLRSVVGESQKVMAEIDGQPFLDIHLAQLRNQGVGRVILCTGFKADYVEEFYTKNDRGLTIDFSKEEEPLGTGGAIKNAKDLIKSENFFVLNGDSFCKANVGAFLEFHQAKQGIASLVVAQADESKDFGGVVVNEADEIEAFLEKEEGHPAKHLNAGLYCFDQDVFSHMPDQKKFSVEYDLFPKLVGKGFYGFMTNQKFFDIGTPKRLEQAKKEFECQ